MSRVGCKCFSKVRACNGQMPESSLFDACLLNPGDWNQEIGFLQSNPRPIMHIYNRWRKNIPNRSLSSCIGYCMRKAPHYWDRAAQLSTVFPLQSWPSCRWGYPEAETPDRSMQRTGEGKICPFTQLHAASYSPEPINCSPSSRWPHLRPIYALCPLLLLTSPHCPLNGNAILIKRAPPRLL